MESFERVRGALEGMGLRVVTHGQRHMKAQCPAHSDNEPSLGIDHRNDRTLLRCYAGCQVDDIIAALGLTLSDLFDGELPAKGDRGMVIRSYVYEAWNGNPWVIKDRYYPKTFIQRLPGTDPGDRSGLKGRPPVLYHLPALLKGIAEGRTPHLVEGEKDVETAERHGLLATCAPSISGAWDPGYSAVLGKADEVIVIIDKDGPGREFATKARDELRAVGVRVRCLCAKTGKDLTDHFEAGHTYEEFVVDTSISVRPRGMDGNTLLNTQFPELRWAIEDVLPAGLGILAGTPKAGKSWIGLDFALAVAAGGHTLGAVPCNRGSVIYLAREDGYRRVQSRMDLLLGGNDNVDLSKFEVVPSDVIWDGGAQGIAALTDWAEEVGDPTLVILDTLAKVEPSAEDGDRYRNEYAMMARYKTFADRFNCAVLAVHHDRKSSDNDGDIFTKISGTRGLTGAVDTMMFLDKKRGEPVGTLHLTGRDVADQEIGLRKSGPLWVLNEGEYPERAHLRRVV